VISNAEFTAGTYAISKAIPNTKINGGVEKHRLDGWRRHRTAGRAI
jgi:hypothetical protein